MKTTFPKIWVFGYFEHQWNQDGYFSLLFVVSRFIMSLLFYLRSMASDAGLVLEPPAHHIYNSQKHGLAAVYRLIRLEIIQKPRIYFRQYLGNRALQHFYITRVRRIYKTNGCVCVQIWKWLLIKLLSCFSADTYFDSKTSDEWHMIDVPHLWIVNSISFNSIWRGADIKLLRQIVM